ncbi:hypothetical protein O991_01672 [Enterococcus faecium 10/96A]|uniref:Uncharacterized protein n=1 Tax=Enterococcus faecium 10/96A TaxID=1391465 RepID=A0AAV3L2P8_ENTFC|nr:hypothetical protein O991_01672 [Enterococcus faecium 10/96A]
MNSCGASPREEQDNRLCVGCYYILDHSLSGLFILRKGGTTMYRPQYLERKHEVIIVQNGNGEIVLKYRRPIKSDTYKRKESNEVIPFRRRRKVK